MSKKQLVIGGLIVGGILLATRQTSAVEPQEGDQRCSGNNLEEYQDGQWVVTEYDSAACGYTPPPPTPPPPPPPSPPDEPPEEVNIYGYIRDSISMEPVEDTYVIINGIKASSQRDGLYWLWRMESVPSVTITIEADGYESYSRTISASKVMKVDIEMVAIEPPPPPPPLPNGDYYNKDESAQMQKISFRKCFGTNNWKWSGEDFGWNDIVVGVQNQMYINVSQPSCNRNRTLGIVTEVIFPSGRIETFNSSINVKANFSAMGLIGDLGIITEEGIYDFRTELYDQARTKLHEMAYKQLAI